MSEFNNTANLGATQTIDISYADLTGANRGQRPDLIVKELCNFRTPDRRLWANSEGVLAPANNTAPFVLHQIGLPVGTPSSGSVAANGNLTGLTAMPFTVFPQPAYLFFPAGALYSGSLAGLYYSVITSASAATVYNDRNVGGDTYAPVTPTPIVAAGPGAYTQVTTAITVSSVLLPANTLGEVGLIQTPVTISVANTAGGKNMSVGFAGQAAYGSTTYTTSVASRPVYECRARGANRQVGSAYTRPGGDGILYYRSANLALPQRLEVQLSIATAADFIIVESLSHIIYPG